MAEDLIDGTRILRWSNVTSGWGTWSFLVWILPAGLGLGLRTWNLTALEFLPLFVMVYAASRLRGCQLKGTPTLVTICHWLFVYIFLGLAPLFSFLHGGAFPVDAQTYRSRTVVLGFLAITVGILAFDIGWRLADRHPNSGLFFAADRLFRRHLSRSRVYVFAMAGIVTSIVLIDKFGGLGTLFFSSQDRAELIAAVAGGGEGLALFLTLSTLLRTPSIVSFVSLLILARYRRPLGISGKILLLVSGLLMALISNPVSGSRIWVGTIFIGIGFIVMPWNRQRSVALVTIGITLAVVVVFPFADSYRYSTDVRLSDTLRGPGITDVLTTKGDFDAFQQVLNTVEYVHSHGFTRGTQLAGSLLFWVPRLMWPNKPEATGILVAEDQGYEFLNLSLPLWGELYIDGGFPLIFAGFLFYGAVVNRLDEWYMVDRVKSVPSFAMVFVPIFAPYEFFLLRGCLMPALASLMPILLCFFVNTTRARDQSLEGMHPALPRPSSAGGPIT